MMIYVQRTQGYEVKNKRQLELRPGIGATDACREGHREDLALS
jgi:hypothetical protein